MSATKHKVVWLPSGLLPIKFGFCPSEKAWVREARRMGFPGEKYPDNDAACSEFVSPTQCPAFIVTLHERFDDRHMQTVISLLAHEVVHVWQGAAKQMEEANPSTEFEAYAVQYLLQQVLYAYEETRSASWLKQSKLGARSKRGR